MESRPTGRRDGSAMRAGPSCHRTLDGFVRLTRSTETLGPRPGQTRMAGSMSAGVAHRQRRSRLGASSASKSPPNPSRTAPLEFRRPGSGESVHFDHTSMSSRSAQEGDFLMIWDNSEDPHHPSDSAPRWDPSPLPEPAVQSPVPHSRSGDSQNPRVPIPAKTELTRGLT